ncbi:MAG: glycerol acyltransferase [Candidatus Muproteobacteria bacterium RBG_16_60_9]|uniref:Glycerol acyltransferase n=1 Tax=Candidatus Muproteobacteria bacterium RBG_16_60_9 TaxID=1817755 RepID=A0A1F6VCM5_9PROT|nr:MAG: glycerol acyltransferase [Candidatus Muproteobacteria bacterium RBG_16_60_9]
MGSGSQFRLLGQRRYLPFFIAQAFGAFNDNVYKNVLVILATYQAASYTDIDPALLTNLAGGLFILPYVLFSGIAGELADRYDKALVLKIVKAAEIPVMALAGLGFVLHDIAILLAALFLMGMQSTFFAPAKYGILPEVLHETELVGGNALLESGTFLAILIGTLTAGILATRGDLSAIISAILVIATFGFVVSLAIPKRAPASPSLRVDWRLWKSTWDNIRVAYESRVVFQSLLGASWFWFYGALILAQLPLLSKTVFGGNEEVVTTMLVVFSIGIGAGSLLCERLSGHKVELGLVPFGSIGLTLFAVDLYFASPAAPSPTELGAMQFLAQAGAWRVLFDLGMIGVFGGFFVVPLYALIQQRAPREATSRVIAANNILNAVFIVAAALFGAMLLKLGLTIPKLLLVTGILNVVVAAYIYTLVPEFLLRFLSWLLIHFIYRLRKSGLENIPDEGPALLVCNHVGYVDALVISAACRRPIRFIMEAGIFKIPLLSAVFRGMKAIPVASAKEDPETYRRAFEIVAAELRDGNLVCIFPEGQLTADGEVAEFRPGVMRILKETPVPVVPLALSGLWDSIFSRKEKSPWRRLPKGIWPKIALKVGAPVEPAQVTPEGLRKHVVALRGAWQ